MTIAAARRFYFKHHVNALRGGRDVVRDKGGPKRAFALLFAYMWRHLKQSGIEGAPKVGQFSLALQHGFMIWCRDKHGHSNKTISTYLSYIKAGFRFASVPRLVTDARGREREVRILAVAPHVADGEDAVANVTGLPRSKPRDWIPSDAELAATFDALHSETPHRDAELVATRRYVIMALNTLARPEANTELSVNTQVSFDRGVIDMNPPGRLQNKKARPVIRLTDTLRGWLIDWNLDRPLVYYGKPILAVSNRTLKRAAKRAGVADWQRFTRYTLRHYMATRIRRVPGIPVSREERASWIGHADPEWRTTEQWYESLDIDYLENVQRAIDAVMAHLNTLAKHPMIAPSAIPGTRLSVIDNKKADEGDASQSGAA